VPGTRELVSQSETTTWAGVWLTRHIHTFTYKRLSVFARWRHSSVYHDMYILSLTTDSQCLPDDVTRQPTTTCTYFHLQEIPCLPDDVTRQPTTCTYLHLQQTLSVCQMTSLVSLPRHVHTFTSSRLSVFARWRHSSAYHDMYLLSLIRYSQYIRYGVNPNARRVHTLSYSRQCLTDGVNLQVETWMCFFLLVRCIIRRCIPKLTVYLMTSIAQTMKRLLVRRLMNRLAIMCEEPIVSHFR